MRRPFGLGLVASVAVLIPLAVRAEPLPAQTCEALIEERALLEGGGAGENIARGADWGKASLTAEQLAYIKRLIVVREAVMFRCRSYDVVREPSPPGTASAPDADGKPAAAAGATAKAGAAVPPATRKLPAHAAPAAAKAAPAAARSAPAGRAAAAKPAADEPKPATAKKPAKPNPEAAPRPAKNDAYVPPEGSQSTLKVPAGAGSDPRQQ